jgi:7-keto-8-aminopelargonate synthetase-like enzyme
VIFSDELNHASIIDGCQFAPSKLVPYRHNSAVSLRNRLKRQPEEAGKLVVMDGIFSMSGDIADLRPQLEVAKEFGARVYVDEAHSLGVLGSQGRGCVHQFGLNQDVDIIWEPSRSRLAQWGSLRATGK